MIKLENLQTAAVWSHENDPTEEDFLDLQDGASFINAYAQAFGLHPASVLIGLRLGYLALMAEHGVIVLEEDVEDEEVPTITSEELQDHKDGLRYLPHGVENDPLD